MIEFDSNDKEEIRELQSKVTELENELMRKNTEIASLQEKNQSSNEEKTNEDPQDINAKLNELKNQLEFYERANHKLMNHLTTTEEQLMRTESDLNDTINNLERSNELKDRQMLIYRSYVLDLFLHQSNIALQRACDFLKQRKENDRDHDKDQGRHRARESRIIRDLQKQLHDQEILYRNNQIADFENLQDLHHKEILEITNVLTSTRQMNSELEEEISHIKQLLNDVTTEVQIKNSILRSCFGVLDKNIAKSGFFEIIIDYDPEILSRYLEKHPKSSKTAMDTFLDILDSKIYNLAFECDK
ncbi:hypothetical protein RF11_08600 [Thelohanellus kitauei]|uniref:Uncharacterized protein n=1 Tax=Thelohanellus kitauei TaxID=669202 RepID=A0A0C2J0J0_THEKT|nr:hypothetical protein RF11_08600 [Thelohanellus kitauei]